MQPSTTTQTDGSAQPVYCPFCNSALDRSAVNLAKPTCPRCDAGLPGDVVEALRDRPSGVAAPPVVRPVVPGKAKTLAAILGLMAVMATIAAIFIINTVKTRRDHDYRKGFSPAPVTSQAPAELSVLGFVPARCNLLAGVNLADIRANPLAKEALLEKGPRTIASLGDRLETYTGLTLDDIEQVAVGMELTEKMPRLYILLATRRAYDPAAVIKHVGSAKKETLRGRPVARFDLFNVGEGFVWCLGDRLLAIALRVEPGPLSDLEAIPREGRKQLEGTEAKLRQLVQKDIPTQSLAWIAGDLGPASGLSDFLSIINARTEGWQPLIDAKMFAISLRADRDLSIDGQLLARSAKDMKKAEAAMKKLDWRNGKTATIVVSPEDREPWLSFQARYDADGLRRLFASGIGAP
jgi:hypothetical protein